LEVSKRKVTSVSNREREKDKTGREREKKKGREERFRDIK